MSDYDLVVIGGGAAGLAASRAARWENASVALISEGPLGGDCTFTGCVPSKSLIEASRRGDDFAAAMAHASSVVEQVAANENEAVMTALGVDVYRDRAAFVDLRKVRVGARSLTARKVIIATGSRPSVPPIEGLARTPYRTNETFFERRQRPDSIVILGGGPMGCELGEALARLGVSVTIVDRGERLLRKYEADAAALVQAHLGSLGVDVRLGSTVEAVRPHADGVEVSIGDERLHADELLLAAGRAPNTDGLDLSLAGVDLDGNGFVGTDNHLRTSAPGVFAAGDCNGKQLLSHAADEMGRTATWTALRRGRRYAYDPKRIPHAVFTTPEVAAIGVLEAEAPPDARVAEIEMHANDRALAAGRPAGFVRLIARPSRLTKHLLGGKIVGATIVGGPAAEMINEVALMMRMNAHAGRLAQTVRAYPSWSSIMQKASSRWFFEYEGAGWRPPRR